MNIPRKQHKEILRLPIKHSPQKPKLQQVGNCRKKEDGIHTFKVPHDLLHPNQQRKWNPK